MVAFTLYPDGCHDDNERGADKHVCRRDDRPRDTAQQGGQYSTVQYSTDLETLYSKTESTVDYLPRDTVQQGGQSIKINIFCPVFLN